jgi:2-dehydro-3-deoxy-D-pentonate aldolase
MSELSQDARTQPRGIIPPLLTPVDATGDVDETGLARLIEHILVGGVDALFLLGSTGEGPCWSRRVQEHLVRAACDIIGGRVPVLVGVTHSSEDESLALAGVAADAGADYIVATPYFYVPPSEEGIVRHYMRLAARSPLPVVLYDIPQLTHAPLSVEMLRWLAAEPRIVAIKDSSGDWPAFERLMAFAREETAWSVLMGAEDQMGRAMLAGADGIVPGGANIAPTFFTELVAAARAKDRPRVAAAEARLDELFALYRGRGLANAIKAMKQALTMMGICGPGVSPPLLPLEEESVAAVRDGLTALRLL